MWKTRASINKHQLIKYVSPKYINLNYIFDNTKIGQIYLIGLNNNLLWSNGMNYEHKLEYDEKDKTVYCDSSLVAKNGYVSTYFNGEYVLYQNGIHYSYISSKNIIKGYILLHCPGLARSNSTFDIYINEVLVKKITEGLFENMSESVGYNDLLVFFDFPYSENGFKVEIKNVKNVERDITLLRIEHFKAMKVNIDNMFLVYNKI